MSEECNCCGRKREVVGNFRFGDFGIKEIKLLRRCEFCYEEDCECLGLPYEEIQNERFRPTPEQIEEARATPVR